MQQVINYLQRTVKANTAAEAPEVCVECNFDNDYYGDQICVSRPIRRNRAV